MAATLRCARVSRVTRVKILLTITAAAAGEHPRGPGLPSPCSRFSALCGDLRPPYVTPESARAGRSALAPSPAVGNLPGPAAGRKRPKRHRRAPPLRLAGMSDRPPLG